MFIVSLLLAALLADSPTAWRSQVVFSAPAKLSGCAIGDVLPAVDGLEVVAVGEMSVFVVAHAPTVPPTERGAKGDGNWDGTEVYRSPGELIQCAVGDALPERPGLEIVAVGKAEGAERAAGAGAVYLITHGEAGWSGEIIATFEKLVHGVCVVPGQIVVTGFDQTLVRLTHGSGGWEGEVLVPLAGNGKTCAALGEDFVVAVTDGSIVRARKGEDGYTATVIDQREKARSRINVDGTRILCSDDDGTLTLLEGDARTVLLGSSGLRQRGAVFADLDPARPGLEFGTAGYDRHIRVLWRDGAGVGQVAPYTDDERFHHTAAGNLDADPADELVCVAFSGHVVLVESVPADG